MNDPLFRVTLPIDPEDLMDTQWGTIRACAWLRHEVVRWARSGLYAEIKTKNGMQSLWAVRTPERGRESDKDEQQN